MARAYPSEWLETIRKNQAIGANFMFGGHGFVDDAATMKAGLAEFRMELAAVIAEAKRLHDAGIYACHSVSDCDAVWAAHWGPYDSWSERPLQESGAVWRVYQELDGKLDKALKWLPVEIETGPAIVIDTGSLHHFAVAGRLVQRTFGTGRTVGMIFIMRLFLGCLARRLGRCLRPAPASPPSAATAVMLSGQSTAQEMTAIFLFRHEWPPQELVRDRYLITNARRWNGVKTKAPGIAPERLPSWIGDYGLMMLLPIILALVNWLSGTRPL